MVYRTTDNSYHRAWRFRRWDDDEIYLFFIDTATGAIVDAIDIGVDGVGDISGRVTGFATPGTAADDSTNPPVQMNLPGIMVTATGFPPVYATEDGSASDGEYTIPDVDVMVHVSSVLKSRWVSVESLALNCYCDPQCEDSCDLEDTVPDVDPPASDKDLLFNDANPPAPEDTSQVNAFLAINRAHNWFAALQPNFTSINQQIRCVVNWGGPDGAACNAGFSKSEPPRILSKYPQDDDTFCASSAMSTIMAHEYGHFILSELIPTLILNSDPFVEGFADTVYSLVYDTACFAENYYRVNHAFFDSDPPLETCARRTDALGGKHKFEHLVAFSPAHCPAEGCEVLFDDPRCENYFYCLGLGLAGAFWDLREDGIGEAATDQIFADFAALTRGVLDQTVIIEVLVADDNDGVLSTPGPNQAAIIAAFGIHGWDDPTLAPTGVDVQWDIVGPGPTSPGDFEVDYMVIPPVVTLKATEDETGVRVAEWRIGREVDSLPADIGTITSVWAAAPPHNITVSVGDPAFTPCRDLWTVDIPAQSPGNWSNLELILDRAIRTRAHCVKNGDESGGLIQGIIPEARGIDVAGIGNGPGTPGTLTLGTSALRPIRNITLETVQADSSFIVQSDLGLNGASDDPVLHISGSMSGSIQVHGNIVEPITIDGDVSGDIVADADEDGEGVISGLVTISGEFTGEICDADMRLGGAVPPNVQLSLPPGPTATVCGRALECITDAHCTGGPMDTIAVCG
ncbi:MAG: hypothetical protein IH987_11490, partial [Planctomycetes bacterium]|nr:hypothetical protein [Planctomycetota bacterium]